MSKASKLRHCPALGREISPADCGDQRQSRLACPESCAHNPFGPANYAHLLEIEDRLTPKTMARLAAETPDSEALRQDIARVERQGIHGMHAFFVWKLFFATGKDGTTFARRWEQSGLRELKNDERVLFRAKMQMRIALLEVHRVLDEQRVEAVDLLSPDPAPMIFVDRSFAGMAVRFATVLSWIFPMPHYWRLSGTAVTVPDVREFTAPEIVREIVGHLGGPLTEPEMRRWLAEHFVEFDAAQLAVARLRRRRMFAGLDASYGKAQYELRVPFTECRKRLDASRDVDRDDISEAERKEGFIEARAWFDRPPELKQLTPPRSMVVLGRILLGPSLWRLETFGSEKFSRLRRQFEQHLGNRIRFVSERVDDLAAKMSAKEPEVDESLAPPRLLENPDHFIVSSSRLPPLPPGVSPKEAENDWLNAANRAFLDDRIPALSNRTPREAAVDPSLRPTLIQLMKQRVRSHDERNLITGRTDDINWMLHELDLHEIIFDPPPLRSPATPLTGDDDDWPESPDDDEIPGADITRPPAPPLPDQPFGPEEAFARLQIGSELFGKTAELEEELLASGATIIEDAETLTLDFLTENEFSFAVLFLLQAWFALVPIGCRAPEIDFDDLEEAFLSNLSEIAASAEAKTRESMEAFFLRGPQPGLIMMLMGGFLETAQSAPKKMRPDLAVQPTIMALLKATVDTLDKALRAG